MLVEGNAVVEVIAAAAAAGSCCSLMEAGELHARPQSEPIK